jgi:RNA-directed DNA polymerase
VSPGLDRVRTAARLGAKEQFTALLHHVDVELFRSAYSWLKRDAAPGVDGVTWQEYGEDLERKLADLHSRIHRGAYRAQPSRRHYIPKPDGRRRPLGIAALEEPHDALDALAVGVGNTRVNWVLDADIAGFLERAA